MKLRSEDVIIHSKNINSKVERENECFDIFNFNYYIFIFLNRCLGKFNGFVWKKIIIACARLMTYGFHSCSVSQPTENEMAPSSRHRSGCGHKATYAQKYPNKIKIISII